jgi:hypothetical protein
MSQQYVVSPRHIDHKESHGHGFATDRELFGNYSSRFGWLTGETTQVEIYLLQITLIVSSFLKMANGMIFTLAPPSTIMRPTGVPSKCPLTNNGFICLPAS